MKGIRLVFALFFFGMTSGGIAQITPDFEEQVAFSIPKTLYFTGEKIWLSIQVEANLQPTASRIVYAELWNRYEESVALAKIPLQEGVGFNFLQIPDELPSDQYLLRVFTRVSPYRNLESGLVQEFVTVFNPRVPPEVVADRKGKTVQRPVSTLLSLSAKTVQPDERVDISYEGSEQLVEMAVAVSNPFLGIRGKISSSEIYGRIPDRHLVPELYGHIVEAHVRAGSLDSAASGLYYLSLHGKQAVLLTDKVDGEGSLYFDAGGLRHWDFMIAQGKENQPMTDFEIVSPSPRTTFKPGFQFPKLQITPEDGQFLREVLRASQIEGFFVQEFQNDSIPVVTGFVEDRTFLLDDYNRFEDVETHIKEYVPEVLVRTRDKKKELRVLDGLRNRSFTENPLMLVDAMPVADSDALLRFNPAKFKKMEILTRPFFLNEEIFSGVISFTSFQNDFGGFSLPANAMYVPYPGIQPPVTGASNLFSPGRRQGEVMDWRTVLHWSPVGQIPGKSVSIVAPLTKGTFQVTLKTVDARGKVSDEYAEFEVK